MIKVGKLEPSPLLISIKLNVSWSHSDCEQLVAAEPVCKKGEKIKKHLPLLVLTSSPSEKRPYKRHLFSIDGRGKTYR